MQPQHLQQLLIRFLTDDDLQLRILFESPAEQPAVALENHHQASASHLSRWLGSYTTS